MSLAPAEGESTRKSRDSINEKNNLKYSCSIDRTIIQQFLTSPSVVSKYFKDLCNIWSHLMLTTSHLTSHLSYTGCDVWWENHETLIGLLGRGGRDKDN